MKPIEVAADLEGERRGLTLQEIVNRAAAEGVHFR
jgi:hypothetical protein